MEAYRFDPEDVAEACNDPVFIAFCKACEILRNQGGLEAMKAGTAHPAAPDPDFEYFDPDELGVDPEEDAEVWY